MDHDERVTVSYGLAYTVVQTTVGLDGIYGSGLRQGFANTGKMPAYNQLDFEVSQHFRAPIWGHLTPTSR